MSSHYIHLTCPAPDCEATGSIYTGSVDADGFERALDYEGATITARCDEHAGWVAPEADAWPFKPGDVVHSNGPTTVAEWLDDAPERTVVSDCDGDEWTRKNDGLWWMNRGRTARAKSSDLTEHVGPLTVVRVPEATR